MRKVLAVTLLSTAAAWGQTSATGSITLAGQGTTSSGDLYNFRELFLGEQAGLLLENFLLQKSGDWQLESHFTTGGSGLLSLQFLQGSWLGKLDITRVNRFSDRAFATEKLPSGARVTELFPGTVFLPSSLAKEPSRATLRASLDLSRRLGDRHRLLFRLTLQQQDDGKAVPNVGGISFAENGGPAFYTASLRKYESSYNWGELGWEGGGERWQSSLMIGASHQEYTENTFLPAYGSAELLDFNHYRAETTDDSWWARFAFQEKLGIWNLLAQGIFVDSSADTSGFDRRESDRVVLRSGFQSKGKVESSSWASALGLQAQVHPKLLVSVAGDTFHGDGDGHGILEYRQITSLQRARYTTTRSGGTLETRSPLGKGQLLFRVRFAKQDETTREKHRESLQDDLLSRDRWRVRASYALPWGKNLHLHTWAAWEDEKANLTFRDLSWGYILVPDSSRSLAGGVQLRSHGQSLWFKTELFGRREKRELQAPIFEPVYDPSVGLWPESDSATEVRGGVTLGTSFSRGSLWLDAAVSSERFHFDQDRPSRFLALVNEKTRNFVAAVGGELQAGPKTQVSFNLEAAATRKDTHHTLSRARLDVYQQLLSGYELFFRYALGDLTWPEAPSREFTVQLMALGLRARW
ncbi:MAG: hypothetical protein ACUVRY_00070 [Thermoanaerobaculaceae bacterium]